MSDAALRRIPQGAAVTASFYLVPHLTHRVHVYEFPNPFIATNWGAPGSRRPNPADVDYLLVDRRGTTPEQEQLMSRLAGPGGEFEVIAQEGPITVARRRGIAP